MSNTTMYGCPSSWRNEHMVTLLGTSFQHWKSERTRLWNGWYILPSRFSLTYDYNCSKIDGNIYFSIGIKLFYANKSTTVDTTLRNTAGV